MAKCLVDQSNARVIGCTPKEGNRSTGIFIAASHDLGVPCKLVPSPVGRGGWRLYCVLCPDRGVR
jgi:hypothetical protein